MSEISIVLVNLAALAIAYFIIYPRYAGNDVKRLAWLDIAIGLTILGILAPFNWGSENNFNLLPNWEVPWWIFAILTYAVIELPFFGTYCSRRNLWGAYKASFQGNFSSSSFTATASTKSVHKQLADTKCDWMRKPRFMRFLVIAANIWIFGATIFLIEVGDNVWASLAILHIAILFIFWFMLRTSVRLIAEARDEALDERMIAERNRTYFTAYQVLSSIVAGLLVGLMIYVITQDASPESDGFNYALSFTWPQVQALFWLIWGYAFMAPSMVMAWRESKKALNAYGH
ncbi:MAG: hypothetical protein ACO385_06555 [Candidatus Nanopelagicaceae bacterium]